MKAPVPLLDEHALDALESLPLPLRACPACGGLGMRALRMGEGGIPGSAEIFDEQACPRCGYRGLSAEFARREDYASFVRRLNLTWRAVPGGR